MQSHIWFPLFERMFGYAVGKIDLNWIDSDWKWVKFKVFHVWISSQQKWFMINVFE